MKAIEAVLLCLLPCTAHALDFDEIIDEIDSRLTVAQPEGDVRARLSGTIDAEFYHFDQPAPGLIDTRTNNLFNPRLTLFLDGQVGSHIYFFAQSRIDRGFDPSDHGVQIRLDEYLLRVTPWDDGRFNLQVGKFATVVGNWVPRHSSWENPFITAPLVYENVTAVSDKGAPASAADFVKRFNHEKYEFNPVIWGPSYATGISISGRMQELDYAVEMKNSSLSSRPASWNITSNGFDQPAIDGRLGFRPNQMWNLGVSASEGAYFRSIAEPTLPRGHDIGDYREFVIGQDASFAWHHLQMWAECYEAQFEVPRAGDASTVAYYIEAKYNFAPQIFGAVRWNQQLFDTVATGKRGSLQWGQDVGRVDVSTAYRATAHMQLKLQYSFQQETSGPHNTNHIFAAQYTVRF